MTELDKITGDFFLPTETLSSMEEMAMGENEVVSRDTINFLSTHTLDAKDLLNKFDNLNVIVEKEYQKEKSKAQPTKLLTSLQQYKGEVIRKQEEMRTYIRQLAALLKRIKEYLLQIKEESNT